MPPPLPPPPPSPSHMPRMQKCTGATIDIFIISTLYDTFFLSIINTFISNANMHDYIINILNQQTIPKYQTRWMMEIIFVKKIKNFTWICLQHKCAVLAAK